MNKVFVPAYLFGNETLFTIFIIIMIVIMITTAILVGKELKSKK